MRRLIVITVFFLSACSGSNAPLDRPQAPVAGEISIIPQPASVKRIGGQFELNPETKILVADDSGSKAADILNDLVARSYGFTLGISAELDMPNSIKLAAPLPADGLPDEGYFLKVQPGSIQITGSERGLFYGIQTLGQMLPTDLYGSTIILIPGAEIRDAPRFPYRGMHLDVSRHFMPVDFVKKFISLISRYKYNYFHWHLTDDQGWRIEIKKYPGLTEIGSKRRESMVGKDDKRYVGDGIPVEGFYTQEQIQEITGFAKLRHITIIPEIDMPGHSVAALAAYPELGCRSGYSYHVQTTWKASPDIMCPKEQTFQFIDGVIAEVAELFPDSPYIHIGGDEVNTEQWRSSPAVEELKKKENLRNDAEVRTWFNWRIAKIINKYGKKVIAWDEITDGVPPRDTTVMSWRGDAGGIAAARAMLPVIMAPYQFAFFDRLQGDPAFEPLTISPIVALEKVYSFEPVPAALTEAESRYVIGAQACVWTEFIKTPKDVEYMAFPRTLAFAEVLWSARGNRNFADFNRRLFNELPALDREKVNYRLPIPLGFRDRNLLVNEEAVVDLRSPVKNGGIYYTIDGTTPHQGSTLYRRPFVLPVAPNQEITVKVRVFVEPDRESAVFAARYVRRSGQGASQVKDLRKLDGMTSGIMKKK